MGDSEEARAYWLFADECENGLQSDISSIDISDIIAQVFNHFVGVDLDKLLSMQEVVKLHRSVERWIANGLEERQYWLILRDLKARKRIKQREALSAWLLAALCMYYQEVSKRSLGTYAKIASRYYADIFGGVIAGGTPRSPTTHSVDALMGAVNPTLRRTLSSQLWIEAQYNRDAFLARYHSDLLTGRKFDAKTPENRRRLQAIEDRLLKQSTPTPSASGGHHGILDQQMAFIVGYTVMQALKDAGVQRVKFIATTDERTTHACKWLNGKVFHVDDLEIGINVPPISIDRHGQPIPHACRSFLRIIE